MNRAQQQEQQQQGRQRRSGEQQEGNVGTLAMGSTIAWNEVRSPGAYVDVETGRLYRFLPESINQKAGSGNGGPVIHQSSKQQSQLQQVSTDPFISQQEARNRAEDAGLEAAF